MMFINTRPANRAKKLTVFLQQHNIQVLDLPLLELLACDLSDQDRQILTQIETYQALIFISATAVSYFFKFIQSHQIALNPSNSYIAVGRKTAQTFNDYWQQFYPTPPNLLTPSQFNLSENNEGLLQLPFIRDLKIGEKILLLKGKDGRGLLKNTLLEKGIIVKNVDFYQRVFPQKSQQIFQTLSQDLLKNRKNLTKPIVLITSLTAWQHWHGLIQSDFAPTAFHYLVLQHRIANSMMKSMQHDSLIKVIDDLQPTTIFQAILTLKGTP